MKYPLRILLIILMSASFGFSESAFRTFFKDNFTLKVGSSGAIGKEEFGKNTAYYTDLHLDFNVRAVQKHVELGFGVGYPFLNERALVFNGTSRVDYYDEAANGVDTITEMLYTTSNAKRFRFLIFNINGMVNVYNILLKIGTSGIVEYVSSDWQQEMRKYIRRDTLLVPDGGSSSPPRLGQGFIFYNSLAFSLGYQWKRFEILASYYSGNYNMFGLTINWKLWD
jgi:hypothetical protein